MRPSRKFQPVTLASLEDRVVLSTLATSGGGPTAAQVLPTSGAGASASAALPFHELSTGTSTGGTVQNETSQANPFTADSTVTLTKTVLLSGGGVEKVVDVETNAGNTTNHNVEITLADGSVETETESEMLQGNTTLINETVHLPGAGGVEVFTGQTVD
jgi:hypothetical protein